MNKKVPNLNHHLVAAVLAIFCIYPAGAYTLHVGDTVIGLTTPKKTTPALAVRIGGTVVYGALYSGTAPDVTMHVQKDATEYWLGQYCDVGQFSETGISACRACSIGHYCPGGRDNIPCTYGAISCNGTGATTNIATQPANAPLNKLMSLDEVNQFIPVTDFSDWKMLSCCSEQRKADNANFSTLNDVSNACATNTIGPGTYLFINRYTSSKYIPSVIDSIDGTQGQLATVSIAVFDHPVSYASMHGRGVFYTLIDTNHANYESYTTSTSPILDWTRSFNNTNISNLSDFSKDTQLCVYELK